MSTIGRVASLACAAGLCLLAGPGLVAAQERPAERAEVRAMVIRSQRAVEAPFVERVDSELFRALRDIAGIDTPTVSPIAFEELGIAAGCAEPTSTCLRAVAGTLEGEGVILRHLEVEGDEARLTLAHFDPEAGEHAPEVTVALPSDALAPAVDRAVRRLFSIPEAPSIAASARAEPEVDADAALAADEAPGALEPSDVPFGPSDPEGERPEVSLPTWLVLGSGAALLAGGTVAGFLSASSLDHYEDSAVSSQADADRALERLDTAETQATIANVLFVVGGAAVLAGGVLLALDLGLGSGESSDADTIVRVGAAPGALALWLDGAWEGL